MFLNHTGSKTVCLQIFWDTWVRLVWQNNASQENIRSNHRNRYFRPTRTTTECGKNSIGAQTDQSEWNFHTAKNPQIRFSLLSALGLICDTFLATQINNVSGKRTRKASSERYRTWMFLSPPPSHPPTPPPLPLDNRVLRSARGSLHRPTLGESTQPLSHLATEPPSH